MNIIQSIRGGLSNAWASIRSVVNIDPRSGRAGSIMGVSGGPTKSGVPMDHYRALALPAVFRAVSIISAAMLKVPFYVFREEAGGSKTWDREHPSWTVINRKSHAHILAPQFRETMTAWALLWGNAVAHISTGEDGRTELIPLLPDRTYPVRITPKLAKRYDLEVGRLYYCTTIAEEPFTFEASTCLHIRGLGLNPFWGVDVVSLLSEALGGSAAQNEFGYRFYGGGANPAGFIEMPGGLDEPAEKRFIESIKRVSSGLGSAHKLAVLEQGSKFHPWSVDPEKAQFLEGKEFDIRILAMIIGVKVHKLIDSANNSYASLEMSNQEYKEDDLLPWYCRWSLEYSEKLLSEQEKSTGSHSVGVDDEQMEWVPFAERSTGCVELYNNGIITKDEARRRVNFGRSRSPNADRYRIPANIIFEDQAASVAATDPTARDDSGDPDDAQDAIE